MKSFKRVSICLCIFTLFLFGGFFCLPNFSVLAENNPKNVVNNVIYVTFNDGDETFVNEIPETYNNDVLTLMDNSYNLSVSSVKNYYLAQSFNNLTLQSNFYTNSGVAYKTKYNKNELLPYSLSNKDGYLSYDVCKYTTNEPPENYSTQFFFYTEHLFSCYDCGNSSHSGTGSNCDLDYADDIACICAYYKYMQTSSTQKVQLYEHLERYLREQVALKSVLQQITNLNGNLDSDNDGYVDALTFIFPDAVGVDWSDLLWPHQMALVDLSRLSSFAGWLPAKLNEHGVRGEDSSTIQLLLNNYKYNSATCYSYNLFLFSHLLPEYSNGNKYSLKDANNMELIANDTLAHELGHVLGLADYYTYDNDQDEEPVDYWDLMGFSYNGPPIYLTTYSREKLGFTNSNNIVKITESGTYELYPTCYDEINNSNNNSNNVLAFVYEDDEYSGQKIYIEYRTMSGNFEGGLKNYSTDRKDGLIVYRIDENMKQSSLYGDLLSQGNFYGYPYNIYVFNNVLNNNNTTINNITFQTYDTSKDQEELTKNDINFFDSGLNITFSEFKDGKIVFNIEGGKLKAKDNRDFNSIKLNGEDDVTCEVYSSYFDMGVDFGDFDENEFDINISNGVKTNSLGNYTFTYILTYKGDSSKVINLVRNVRVVDTTSPVVALIGDETIILRDISLYTEQGITYSDNYDVESDLIVNISSLILIDDTHYKVTYSVKDSSNNETIIYRYITILDEPTDFSSVKLIGKDTVNLEVKTEYKDSGIDYGDYSENDFDVIVKNTIKNDLLGSYSYTYSFTYKTTKETFKLTRTVLVVDTTKPIITLLGDMTLSKYRSELASLSDNNYSVSDNYYSSDQITVTTSLEQISETLYHYCFVATDASGNVSDKVYRTINILIRPITKAQIQLEVYTQSKNEEYYANASITLKANVHTTMDNERNPIIKFIINDEEKQVGTSDTFTCKFSRSGIYTVKIQIGNEFIETDLIIQDAPKESLKTSAIVFIVVMTILVLCLFIIIMVKSAAKKIEKNIDKY